MKNTQMIHSPRTFKLGLGLILAAGLISMPVLTGASEKSDTAKAKAKTSATSKKLSSQEKAATSSKSKPKAKTKPRTTSRSQAASRSTTAEQRARARITKLEGEAKKIAATLTPTQRTKLLALLNDAKSEALTGIDGIGKSRSAAIESARPIKAIEDLPKVKGVGIKTYADLVDHGRTLTRSRSKSSTSKSKPTSSSKKSSSSKSSKSKKA